jgi:hypothetical protein
MRELSQCFAEGTDRMFSMNTPADASKKLLPVAQIRWRLVDGKTIVRELNQLQKGRIGQNSSYS